MLRLMFMLLDWLMQLIWFRRRRSFYLAILTCKNLETTGDVLYKPMARSIQLCKTLSNTFFNPSMQCSGSFYSGNSLQYFYLSVIDLCIHKNFFYSIFELLKGHNSVQGNCTVFQLISVYLVGGIKICD